jgi:hypothetical protein
VPQAEEQQQIRYRPFYPTEKAHRNVSIPLIEQASLGVVAKPNKDNFRRHAQPCGHD